MGSVTEILSWGAWQGIGVLAGVLFGMPTIFGLWLQTRTKEVAAGLLQSARLLTVSEQLTNRVLVTLDGTPVKDVHLISFGLKNSGHQPIARADWDSDFSLDFGPGATVVSAAIAQSYPPSLLPAVAVSASVITVEPVMLNAGWSYVVQAMVSAPSISGTPHISILGVSRTRLLREGSGPRLTDAKELAKRALSLFLLSIFLYWVVVWMNMGTPEKERIPPSLAPWAFLVTFLIRLVAEAGAWLWGRITNAAHRWLELSSPT